MHQLAHSPLFNEPSIPAISTDANAEKKKKKSWGIHQSTVAVFTNFNLPCTKESDVIAHDSSRFEMKIF